MTTQDAAQRVIDAVQQGKLSRATCEERIEEMERKAQAGETVTPFATPDDLAACCAMVRAALQMPVAVITTQAQWEAYRATLPDVETRTPAPVPVETVQTEDFLTTMRTTPTAPSPALSLRPCGHLGHDQAPACFVCLNHMWQEMATFGRVTLHQTDTPAFLTAMGLSRSSVWRALKRGWCTLGYHHTELVTEEGIGGFAALNDPYAFAHSQVTHILNLWGIGLDDRTLAEDMVQEGLLKCWELRHRAGVRSWPAFFSTVIRRKVQDMLPRELRYALWGEGAESPRSEIVAMDAE